MNENGRIRVGVAGATGYAGVELLRRLAKHPAVDLRLAMGSSNSEARRIPALARIWDEPVQPFDIEKLISNTEAVFLAVPDTLSAEVAPVLAARGATVFDLSGAFRLRNPEARQRWYPHSPAVELPMAYGLTERYRGDVEAARLVACPGCYPTAAVLALQPLVAAGLIQPGVIVDAKSGVSGAGKSPSERTHFSECHDSISAYGVFSHRHGAEIEQEVGMPVTFVPHLVPLDRGILETIYASLRPGTTEQQVADALQQANAGAPFVRLTGAALPEIKHVAHTNFCDIGWKVDEAGGRIVLVAVIDNLVKGAAGSAVQNLNVMLGLDERTGLL
jgi:N-acetyl-gamma-glutamyl-phosphate reductase